MSAQKADLATNLTNLSMSSSDVMDSSASRLMSLPRELRDQIWTFVLGPRTVHVRSETYERPVPEHEIPGDDNDGTYDKHEEVYTDTLFFDRCYELVDEYQAFNLAQKINLDDPYGLRPTCGSNGRRHDMDLAVTHCRYCVRHGRHCEALYCKWHGRYCQRQHEFGGLDINTGDFSIFRVSRQTRRETKAILYTIITFSFQHAHTLKTFVNSLSPSQRQSVRNVQLNFVNGATAGAWSSRVNDSSTTTAMLTGLRTLHVNIRQRFFSAHDLRPAESIVFDEVSSYGEYIQKLLEDSLPWWKNCLIEFCHLPLRSVTVIVDNDDVVPFYTSSWDFHDQEIQMRRHGCWTMAEKAEFARLLKAKLLARKI